ncbi:hypothetical protein JCM30237_23520 [Halolamina litorea]|uniref:SWIM zinc finger family protein n=1 Tax=Halolamina litorea TaxID=1515593 RepID=A0ABD6BVB8_9EURY|nr:SWIM zinc finger family protein [Halolamina litorea]
MIATDTTNGATESGQRELDRRDELALTQYLTVIDDLPAVAGDDDRYVVVSESGAAYVVDLGASTCTCPDYRYRGGRCKHIRRVEFATGERPIPPWVEGVDPDLGRHVGGPGWGDPEAEFPPGAAVRDRHTDRGGLMRVIRVLDEHADEYEINAGRTVADYNPDNDPAERVVEVVFEGDLDRHVAGWRQWAPADLPARLDAYCREWGVAVRTYAFPHGRIKRAFR